VNAPGGLRTDLEACLPQNYVGSFIRYQPVYPSRLRAVDFTWTTTALTSHVATTSNVAASIERYSKLNKRRGIGRIQLPLPQGVFAGGIINDAVYLAALDNLREDMLDDIVTDEVGTIGTWQPVIHNTSAAQPLTSYIDGASVKTTVRTMHRRTLGLGI